MNVYLKAKPLFTYSSKQFLHTKELKFKIRFMFRGYIKII